MDAEGGLYNGFSVPCNIIDTGTTPVIHKIVISIELSD